MIQNIKEFRNLIVIYDRITTSYVDKTTVDMDYTFFHADKLAQELTGFGSANTCKVCQPLLDNNNLDCSKCIYHLNNPLINNDYYCAKGPNRDTYIAFLKATNEEDLIICYRARAEHMKNLLKCYQDEILNQINSEKVSA